MCMCVCVCACTKLVVISLLHGNMICMVKYYFPIVCHRLYVVCCIVTHCVIHLSVFIMVLVSLSLREGDQRWCVLVGALCSS